MNVVIIRHQGRTVAVVEQPEDVEERDVVRHWNATQGNTPGAMPFFTSSTAPLIPWDSVKGVFVPCDPGPVRTETVGKYTVEGTHHLASAIEGQRIMEVFDNETTTNFEIPSAFDRAVAWCKENQ